MAVTPVSSWSRFPCRCWQRRRFFVVFEVDGQVEVLGTLLKGALLLVLVLSCTLLLRLLRIGKARGRLQLPLGRTVGKRKYGGAENGWCGWGRCCVCAGGEQAHFWR